MTPPQHMVALERANEVRIARAQDLGRLRAGEVQVRDLDLEADYFENCRVMFLLRSCRWSRMAPGACTSHRQRTATVRPARVLRHMRLSERATIGNLSEARKAELVAVIERFCTTQGAQERV